MSEQREHHAVRPQAQEQAEGLGPAYLKQEGRPWDDDPEALCACGHRLCQHSDLQRSCIDPHCPCFEFRPMQSTPAAERLPIEHWLYPGPFPERLQGFGAIARCERCGLSTTNGRLCSSCWSLGEFTAKHKRPEL